MIAPRIGYSLIRDKWNVKLSYAESFKLPTIENFYLGPEDGVLKPENNATWDMEVGVRLSKQFNWRINAFKNKIDNPIVYVFDDITYDNYINRPSVANRGAESMLTYLNAAWTIRAAASYQKLDAKNTDLPEVRTPRDRSVQGLSNILGHVIVAYQFHSSCSISATAGYKGPAFNYEYIGESTELAPVEYGEVWKFNVFANYSPPKWSDFEFRIGFLNILDTEDFYLSPYSVGNDAMPTTPRELMFMVNYRITH